MFPYVVQIAEEKCRSNLLISWIYELCVTLEATWV